MLAGQPPFQSSSQSEIYRRAKNVEYAWPDESQRANHIPEEAKDLVVRLLKVDAEERPDPDEVIGHPFFAMHNGRNIPAMVDANTRYQLPDFINGNAEPKGDVMWDDAKRLTLRALAKQCGVGILAGDRKAQPAVGSDASLSLYMECIAEEQSGASPIVPLPQDFVYASKFPSTVWATPEDSVSEDPVAVQTGNASVELSQNLPPTRAFKHRAMQRPRRAPVQSHAATLRAAHVSMRAPPPGVFKDELPLGDDYVEPNRHTVAPTRQRKFITDLPIRPPNQLAPAKEPQAADSVPKPRVTRSKKVVVLDDPVLTLTEPDVAAIPMTKDDVIDKACVDPDAKRRELASKNRVRIASNVMNELEGLPQRERKPSRQNSATQEKQVLEAQPVKTMIGPNEPFESLLDSKPEAIIRRLQDLHSELRACLTVSARYKKVSHDTQEIDVKSKSFKSRPVVVKWVDYTNKFGIGYILANGSVGCVFKGDHANLPTCVMVSHAESHFKKRNSLTYPERHQIVSLEGSHVEFVENCGLDGLKRVSVHPSQYQIRVNTSGIAEKLGPGFDAFDFEKRKKLCLWDKFGKYMTSTLGKGDNGEQQAASTQKDADSARTSRSRRAATVTGTSPSETPFVKFYQRLGNAGIWGFGDGSFQFNFPDHTKLVISSDGCWLDFYHLPVSAAQTLQAGHTLGAGALAERSVLCYPTDILLSGSYGRHDFADIVRENELKAKVDFARDVVGTWVKEGGLGVMGRKRGVKWDGITEKGGKLVWVTVGAMGGDERYEIPTGTASTKA